MSDRVVDIDVVSGDAIRPPADCGPSMRFAGLDLIRFAAAAAVMLFHLAYWSWHSPADTAFRASGGRTAYLELVPLAWFGWVGVEVFFVLSGVVISYSASGCGPWRFLRGRMGRLLPALWMCVAITVVATLVLGLEAPARLARLTLDSLILWPYGPWLDGVYWTLPVEIAFYALIWLILAVRAFADIERWAAVLGVASALFWLARIAGMNPLGNTLATYLLLRHGCFFSLGIYLWLVAEQGITAKRAVPILIAVSAILVEISDTAIGRIPAGMTAWTPSLYCLLMIGLMYASLRYAALLPTSTANWTRRLGLMTYPLYLLHGLIGCGMLRTGAQLGRWPALALGIAASLAASWLVVAAEPPVRRWLYRLLDAMAAHARAVRTA